MEKLYTPKTFLKMADGRMHTLILLPRSARTISYRNHEKSLAYFSHLAPLVLLFFNRRQSQKGGGHGTMPLNTLLPRSLGLGACERIISLFK